MRICAGDGLLQALAGQRARWGLGSLFCNTDMFCTYGAPLTESLGFVVCFVCLFLLLNVCLLEAVLLASSGWPLTSDLPACAEHPACLLIN